MRWTCTQIETEQIVTLIIPTRRIVKRIRWHEWGCSLLSRFCDFQSQTHCWRQEERSTRNHEGIFDIYGLFSQCSNQVCQEDIKTDFVKKGSRTFGISESSCRDDETTTKCGPPDKGIWGTHVPTIGLEVNHQAIVKEIRHENDWNGEN